MEDSHPFAVTFEKDNPDAKKREGVYETALQLTELVDRLIETTTARFYLKDTLDKSSTVIALRIGQAAGETSKSERRRQYRIARRAASDCAAILDIMARRAGTDPETLGPARQLVIVLATQLAHLAVK
jgi:four helix bundle protein